MDKITLALWAANLARPLNGIDAWAEAVETQIAETKAAGAVLFVMPEYVSEHWLSFAPEYLKVTDEVAWMAEQGRVALEAIEPLATRYEMAILAGTMPVTDGNGGFYNRAWFILPDGRRVAYDKLVLTPTERNPAGWCLQPGERIQIVEWEGLRIAPLVCLDIEMPALAWRLQPLDLDLLLVPSMTSFRSGYRRVFDCAKARAIELQTLVATVGAIGVPKRLEGRDSNISGAAVFTPCEAALGHDGVVATIGPRNETEGPGPMLIARDLPVAELRALRRGKAEVWPGAWSAEHLTIETTGEPKKS
jgi:predicted amidohydrolase